MDSEFLKWRGELNGMKLHKTDRFEVLYKEYKGALEILDVQGTGVPYYEFMLECGYERINISDCFFGYGLSSNLQGIGTVGIPQRMCFFPPDNNSVDYTSIKPSLLISDVF